MFNVSQTTLPQRTTFLAKPNVSQVHVTVDIPNYNSKKSSYLIEYEKFQLTMLNIFIAV